MILPSRQLTATALTLFLGCSIGYWATASTLPFVQGDLNKITQTEVPKDTAIIPGQRVGMMTRQTTRRDLTQIFGESQLRDRQIPGPEGMGTLEITEVQLTDGRSLSVVWTDATRTQPARVQNLGTAWKTPEGIGIGTSLAELRQQLGEFNLYGLAWDYGGTVILEGTRLSRYQGQLSLQLDPDPDAVTRFPKDYRAVSGDGQFSSTNPHWQPLGMHVGQITVILNAPQ